VSAKTQPKRNKSVKPMATLTLSFKGRLLSVHRLDEHPTSVGRDPDCRVCIDSLAIASRHAEIVCTDGGFLLLSLDPEYPVLLNHEKVDQVGLRHGDLIQIGKHTLSFSEESVQHMLYRAPFEKAPEPVQEEASEYRSERGPAYLQVQSGPKIGRVVVFRRAVTRLSQVGASDVIVTRRSDAYHLSRLGGKDPIRIAGKVMDYDEEAELHNNDLIEIGDVRLRFFAVKEAVPAGGGPPGLVQLRSGS